MNFNPDTLPPKEKEAFFSMTKKEQEAHVNKLWEDGEQEPEELTTLQKKWYDSQVKEWDEKRIQGKRVAIPYGMLHEQALKKVPGSLPASSYCQHACDFPECTKVGCIHKQLF